MPKLLRDWFFQLALGAALLMGAQAIGTQLASYLLATLGALLMSVGAIRGLYSRAAEQKALAESQEKSEP